jgi:hypothetical protein
MIFAFFLFTLVAGFDLNCELRHVEHDINSRLEYYSKECVPPPPPPQRTKLEECEQPSLDYLQKLYNALFYGIYNVIDSPYLRPKLPIINSYFPIKNDALTYGNRKCLNYKRIHDHELGLCTYHHQIEYRNNTLYPVYKSHAICNCKKCALIDHSHYDANFGCEKIKRLEPVLRRTEKCLNGLYVYEPAYEYVSIACVCKKLMSQSL